jgi:hypothetical protein
LRQKKFVPDPMQRKPPASPLDLIDTEIIQEQASALGRLGRALEAALQTLREFDAAVANEPGGSDKTRRAALVAQAGHALWMFVVQRESCGLRDSRAVMRDYAVPPEVQARMGLLPAPPPGKRRRTSPSPTSGSAGVRDGGAASVKRKTPP